MSVELLANARRAIVTAATGTADVAAACCMACCSDAPGAWTAAVAAADSARSASDPALPNIADDAAQTPATTVRTVSGRCVRDLTSCVDSEYPTKHAPTRQRR
eukprot:357329-Chlamydomonas_euryale.AAC.10